MIIILLSYQIVTPVVPDVELKNAQERVLLLKKDVTQVLGIQVPDPIVIDQGLTNFSQMAIQAHAHVNQECQLIIVGKQGDQNVSYIVKFDLDDTDKFLSYQIDLSETQSFNNLFVYFNVTSQCDVELSIVAAAVHQLYYQLETVTQISNTLVALQKREDVIQQITRFETDSNEVLKMWACSEPVITSFTWYDCRYYKADNGYLQLSLDYKDFDYSRDSIFYSIQQNTNSKLQVYNADVKLIEPNQKYQIYSVLDCPDYFYLQTSDCFQVLKIDNNQICFTRDFAFPHDSCDYKNTKTGQFKIQSELKHLFITNQNSVGNYVQFQINKCKEKSNLNWIIWVVCGMVGVVITGSAFFWVRNKNKNKRDIYEELEK
ncbi:Conserved_hypothetical protein [Hexamita inflata]|uniref:Transmembrane protein n=1 Tax=Hexamita inflata TaxID=28002 RepID=A0ABP1H6A8_9EUKA